MTETDRKLLTEDLQNRTKGARERAGRTQDRWNAGFAAGLAAGYENALLLLEKYQGWGTEEGRGPMNLATAKQQMAGRILEPGDHWMYLSKDGGKHGCLTNELQSEELGYTGRDVLYVWEGREGEES